MANEPKQNIASLHDIYVATYIDNYNLDDLNNASKVPTLEIYVSDQRFSGNTGCNFVQGSLVVTADSINFTSTPMMTTLMICEWDSLEQAYLQALEKTETYIIEGNEVFLIHKNEVIVKLQKVD